MATQHTPTPWVVEDYRPEGGKLDIFAEGCCMANMVEDSCFTEEERLANAAFIIRSANAHAPMLAALKKARARLRDAVAPDELALRDEIDHAISLAVGMTFIGDDNEEEK